MLLSLRYAIVCGLLRLHLVSGKRLTAAEIELLALRHERRVVRRRTGGAAWRPADRLLLAALSRCLPPGERHRLPVHSATVRRWQREPLERRWIAQGRRRPPLALSFKH
jgi:putative transposase